MFERQPAFDQDAGFPVLKGLRCYEMLALIRRRENAMAGQAPALYPGEGENEISACCVLVEIGLMPRVKMPDFNGKQ